MRGAWIAVWRWVPLTMVGLFFAAPFLVDARGNPIFAATWGYLPVVTAAVNWVVIDAYLLSVTGRRRHQAGTWWPFHRTAAGVSRWRTIYLLLATPVPVVIYHSQVSTWALLVVSVIGPVGLAVWNLSILGRYEPPPKPAS